MQQKLPVSPWKIACCGIPCGCMALFMLIGVVGRLMMTPEQRAAQGARIAADEKRSAAERRQEDAEYSKNVKYANDHPEKHKQLAQQDGNSVAPITMSASSLYAAYDQNTIAADQKYTDKLVSVSGEIESIDRGIDQNPYITLKTGNMFSSVQCTFEHEKEGQIATLFKGNSVKVLGTCRGKTLNVLLSDCTVE